MPRPWCRRRWPAWAHDGDWLADGRLIGDLPDWTGSGEAGVSVLRASFDTNRPPGDRSRPQPG